MMKRYIQIKVNITQPNPVTCWITLHSPHTHLVFLAEILEEALDVVEEELVVGGEDEVDDVARLRERLEGERLPEVQRLRRQRQEVPLVADRHHRHREGLNLVVGVALKQEMVFNAQ